MKNRGILLVILVSLFAFGCSSSKKTVVNNQELDGLMEQQTFEFTAKKAEPQVAMLTAMVVEEGGGFLVPGSDALRFNIKGYGFFLKLKGEQVSVDLPYFREHQKYDGAKIKFENEVENLTIVKNPIKNSYEIKFKVNDVNENYDFTIKVKENLSTSIAVTSPNHNPIKYQGTLAKK